MFGGVTVWDVIVAMYLTMTVWEAASMLPMVWVMLNSVRVLFSSSPLATLILVVSTTLFTLILSLLWPLFYLNKLGKWYGRRP